MTRDEWRDRHLAHAPAWSRLRRPRRMPTCHPAQPHLARGLCRACYERWYRAGQALAAAVAELRALARETRP